jgi:hypothetical protein
MDKRFADLANEGRPALVTYFMGGDPDFETSLAIMKSLPLAGSDVIELGMPFSDPMADGPAIQLAGQRARTCPPLPRRRQGYADRPDGVLQPDLYLRRRSFHR